MFYSNFILIKDTVSVFITQVMLRRILEDSERKGKGPGLGAFTGEYRHEWAKVKLQYHINHKSSISKHYRCFRTKTNF